MKKQKMISLLTTLILLSTMCMFYPLKSEAVNIEYPLLSGKWFYIKNALTGQYLTVNGNYAGANVEQYEFVGSNAQKWFIFHNINGEYMLFSGASGTGSTSLALDVDNGINANGTQIHVWNAVAGGTTQTFAFEKMTDCTYKILTKCSNYTKVASLADNLCWNGINVHQWEYSGDDHDHWILEPTGLCTQLGFQYADLNYNNYVRAFPNLSEIGGDCTNFVSQCLLTEGALHQSGSWYINKKNMTYEQVYSNDQLDYSWELADPSPWTSASCFKNYFSPGYALENIWGPDILNNPDSTIQCSYQQGDVIQWALPTIGGLLGNGKHSMFVRGFKGVYLNDTYYLTYDLTYHSNNIHSKDLFTVISEKPLFYYVFYDFT